MKKSIVLVLLLSLLLGVFTACSSKDSRTPNESNSSADTVVQILRHNEGLPGTCDPAGATDNTAAIIFVNVYDTLVFPDAQGEMQSWVAEDWEISEDGLTYTFHLREGVQFHNGGELTASDVIFSMERLLAIGQGYGYLFSDVYESSEAKGDYTVVFQLKKPFGPFLSSLCRLYIVSEDIVMANIDGTVNTYGEYGDYGTGYLLETDAGSGPYTISSFSQLDRLVAKKFDGFWNGWDEQAPEQIEIIFTTESSTIRTLMGNNQLDISDPFQSSETLASLNSLEGIDLVNYVDGLCQYLTFNTALAPTDDLNYRKALASLIDYATVSSFFAGGNVATGLISSTIPGSPQIADFGEYQKFDLDQAEQYFAKSVYANQLNEFPLIYTVHNEDVALEKLGLLLKEALSRFNIEMEIKIVPWLTFTDNVAQVETTPNITSYSNGASYWDSGSLIEGLFSSKTAGTWENPMWLHDEALDKMIAEALSVSEDSERYSKYEEIIAYVMDLCPLVCIADMNRLVAYNADKVEWLVADLAAGGNTFSAPTGYTYYFHDCLFKNK